MVKAGSKVGLKVTGYQNSGQVSQYVQGMNTAISNRASAIDLFGGINPGVIGPQIRAAKTAGIGTVASHFYDVGQTPAAGLGGTADAPYKQAGKLLADYAIRSRNKKMNALVVTVNDVLSTQPMVDGIKGEVQKYCPGTCKLTYTNASVTDFQTKIPSGVQASLQRDPSINYIIALYDSVEVPFVLSGVRAANAVNRVKINTFNGTPSILKLVQSGEIEMDVGEDLVWNALAIVDQHLRLFGGLAPLKDPGMPLRIWDKSNINEAGSPPKDGVGYGHAWVAGYEQLWKLAPGTLDGLT